MVHHRSLNWNWIHQNYIQFFISAFVAVLVGCVRPFQRFSLYCRLQFNMMRLMEMNLYLYIDNNATQNIWFNQRDWIFRCHNKHNTAFALFSVLYTNSSYFALHLNLTKKNMRWTPMAMIRTPSKCSNFRIMPFKALMPRLAFCWRKIGEIQQQAMYTKNR